MAKKKTDDVAADTPAPAKTHPDFVHEIWGLIYLATGVLVLISLISHFTEASPHANILGQWVGTNLAIGLVFLLGPFASFFFPVVVCYIGVVRIINAPLRLGTLILWSCLVLESCILLAIHHLPALALDPSFATGSNNIGLFFVSKLLRPVFGPHCFGPYFIFGLAMLLTVLWGLKINPRRLFALVWTFAKKAWAWGVVLYKMVQARLAAERAARETGAAAQHSAAIPTGAPEESTDELPEESTQKKQRPGKKPAVAAAVSGCEAPGSADGAHDEPAGEDSELVDEKEDETIPGASGADDVEEEARRRLEEELAAFRARKREPIKIMTIETAEVPDPEEEVQQIEGKAQLSEDEVLEETHEFEGLESGSEEPKPKVPLKPYEIPGPEILPDPPPLASMIDEETIRKNSAVLEKTLMNFGVEGKVVYVSPGPVVTRYEIELAPGIKVSRVVALHDDISMAVGGQRIRIEAPIPGKSAVGIELPNPERQIVYFKHVLTSDTFRKSRAKIPVVIGTNISGASYVTDITKMPHVLIAGQTGSGKSVCINSLICSILMTKKPEELRLIMIDPKKVELAFYEGIPHLLSPVVTESKEAVKALQWGVREMERRYRVLAKVGARNIDSFNQRIESGKLKGILPDEDNKVLPFIVIIVDELADLMMTASKDVEGLVQRIAQLARAVGLHLIVATQRPSVDIITGPIKANLTSRIAFRTIQSTDSRTILGHVGAEKLLGMGDMLFLRSGAPEIERFHGSFISEEDVETIVSKVREQQVDIERIESFHDAADGADEGEAGEFADGDLDVLFEEAARTIVSIGQGSTSLLQRRMKIGYARAGRLMDELERAGFVGPPDGSKAREVLVKPLELDELLGRMR